MSKGFKPKMIFAVCPSATFVPLHYLLNFRVFTLIFAVFLSYSRVELLSVYKDLMWKVPMAEYHITKVSANFA